MSSYDGPFIVVWHKKKQTFLLIGSNLKKLRRYQRSMWRKSRGDDG